MASAKPPFASQETCQLSRRAASTRQPGGRHELLRTSAGPYHPARPVISSSRGASSARSLAHREVAVSVNIVVLQPFIALVAGILILLVPRLLNYVVAVYLILIGLTGLWPRLFH